MAGEDGIHGTITVIEHMCQILRPRAAWETTLVMSPKVPALQDTVCIQLVETTTHRDAVFSLP